MDMGSGGAGLNRGGSLSPFFSTFTPPFLSFVHILSQVIISPTPFPHHLHPEVKGFSTFGVRDSLRNWL